MKNMWKNLLFLSLALVMYLFMTERCEASSYRELKPDGNPTIVRLKGDNRNLNYKVIVDEKGFQSFDFEYLENPNNDVGRGFDIEIYTSGRKQLIHSAYGIQKDYFGGYFSMPKGEELLIEIRENFDNVDPVNGIDIKFNFHTHPSNYSEIEFNDDFETATKLYNEKDSMGSLHSTNDVDYFVYKLPHTGGTTFTFQRHFREHSLDVVADGWNVAIYDGNKNLISEKRGVKDYIFSDELKYKKGQLIYIKVYTANPENEPYLIDYKLTPKTKSNKFFEAERNDSFKKANTISSKKIGTLETENDVDYYVFKAKKKGTYRLNIKTGDLNGKKYNVALYLKAKGKAKLERVVGKNQAMSIKLKKGEKVWIKISGKNADFTPIAKEYTLTIKK